MEAKDIEKVKQLSHEQLVFNKQLLELFDLLGMDSNALEKLVHVVNTYEALCSQINTNFLEVQKDISNLSEEVSKLQKKVEGGEFAREKKPMTVMEDLASKQEELK